MIQGNLVDLGENLLSLRAGVWNEKFEADRGSYALANDGEKEFDPTHQAVEESFAFRMHVMDEAVERWLVGLDEIYKCLYGAMRVSLGD